MKDRIIEAIRNNEISADLLTPEYLRNHYCRDIYDDGRVALDRGKSIFQDPDQLDQYLYTYGKMVNQQWKGSFQPTLNLGSKSTIIDYGCGQGLSLLNFLDIWKSTDGKTTWEEEIGNIVLIEPSKVALKRAEEIAKLKFPDIDVKSINKKLEQLEDSDISFHESETYVHIFSQILDMPLSDEFCILDFFETITSKKGIHYLLVISHDIKETNNTYRILSLYKYIAQKYIHNEISLESIKLRLAGKEVSFKKVTDLALNSFKIEDKYESLSVFACIKTS